MMKRKMIRTGKVGQLPQLLTSGFNASWKVLAFFKFQDLESPRKSLWSWKLKFKVLESPGKISLKITRH